MPKDKENISLLDVIASLQESTRGFREEFIQQVESSQRTLQETLQPFLDTQRRLSETLQIGIDAHRDILERLRDFQVDLGRTLIPLMEDLRKSAEELPGQTRSALYALGQHGWYLDPEIPHTAIWHLEAALTEGNVEEAERTLCEYFRNRAPDIAESLIAEHPRRAHLIRSAFNAHERGEYELSIPVLLAQANGICVEATKYELFSKRDRAKIAAYVDMEVTNALMAAVLSPLTISLPISFTEGERGPDFAQLNRHVVLHGESVDYGTELNSLKAISLLNYVAYAFRKHDELGEESPSN
jgi:hypothetical protein